MSRAASSIFDWSMRMPAAYASTAAVICERSHGTCTKSRCAAVSRSATYSRTSSAGTPRPSPNAATLRGSRNERPSSVSGMPTSAAPSTSPDSVPSAWPSWEPNMKAPICLAMPMSGAAICASSGGSPSGRPCCGSIPCIDSLARTATGSTMRRHDGSVASIHSLRLHAPPPEEVAGNDVTGSSHIEARSRAASTSRRSVALTDGSPSATTNCRAPSRASSQLTGPASGPPPCAIIRPSCWSASPSWLMSKPPGPNPSGPGVPEPPPWSSSSPGGVKPKGRLPLIGLLLPGCAGAGWGSASRSCRPR